MGNKCCKCQSSTYSSANATIRSFSSYNSSIVRSGGSNALTFGETSTHGNSLTTLTMKSSDHSDVGKDYRDGSLSTVGQEDQTPVFLRRLNDLNARVGTRTRLLIELDDASGVQVRWYHNNLEAENDRYQYIHEGGFYCLDIVPVTLEDEGLWVCTAQNYAGKSSTAAHLSLIVPKAFKKPIFIEPLRAVLTQRGIVSLECKVIGVPTPKLRWYKDHKEIKAGDIFALTANSEDCLGIYTCEATNVMGTAVSTSKIQVAHMQPDSKSHADSLIPYGPSPKFMKGLKNVTGKVGNALILECQVEVPPWPRSVGWYNDAGIVNEGPLYHLIADGTGMYGVEIKSLRADHSTTWKCIVTSLTGVKAVTSCLVTVSYPKNYRVPRFLESLRAIMTDEGLVSFECKVIGYPTPQLSWFKDGKQLQPGDVYELTGSKSLGSYCCVARNCMGETSSLAELTMEDIQNQLNENEKLQLTSNTQPPRFLLGLKSTEANINESFVFMIKVTTESTPSINWYKDDEELTESNRYKFSTEDNGIFVLNIVPLEINDQAEWKCVAINKFGQTVTSSFLKLNIPKNFKPPKFIEELRIAFSNEGSVNLECKVIGVPQPQLKWFKDGQELNPGDMHKIISGQSGTCCLGTYTCQAHNCMGTVTSSATLLTMEDKSTVKSCASEEYLSVGNILVRNESLSTIPEERTSQMEKSYTIEEPADISFSFDGKEVTVSLYETPDLTHDEALQIIEMYADELSEHISEDNVVDLPSLRIVKESSISGPVMMEALVIDVPIDFCQQQTVSDTQFDGVSLSEDTTLANVDKNDSLCENSLEYFSDHLSSSNSKKDIFFSVSESTPKNASVILRQQSEKEVQPKLFMSNSDDQILTQLNLEEKYVLQTSRNAIGPLTRSGSNNTEEEISETLADIENEQLLPHNYCTAEISTHSDEDELYSAMLSKLKDKGIYTTLSSEKDEVLKVVSRSNVDEFLKYMKIILEGIMVKMHTHENFNYADSPTELERSIKALYYLAWKFIVETEKNEVTELDKNTTENVSSLMTAINASLLALEQIDDPFGVSDNVLNEIQSSVCFDFETLNNKDLLATDILKHLSDQIRNFTTVVNRQVAQVTEQRIMAVLRNTIGSTLVYIKTLQQNSSKIKCIDENLLVSIFSMVQPLETILNDVSLIEEASAEDGKCDLKLKQMLIPPISSIAFSLNNLNTALKNENSIDDQDLRDIYSKINDATNQFMMLASQGINTNNLAECFISFTKPINDLCCHLRRLGRSTENIISSDYGSDDKLLMDFETIFDELMIDIDMLINNVNIVRDSENNMNPLGSLLEPLQDMKIGLFQVNQVLLSNQTDSNISYEVMICFEHLSHQLVQLNNCIINQSIIEETDKEIPFESSIKMMQNILFDDAIDDLGVNGILFGSVMKPLLHLQNLIVSKMASVESDLSFSEHTDATGGAQSLSLSLSNNAQTVFNKPDKEIMVPGIAELSGIDNTTKEYDENNKLTQASSSKIIKGSMILENNEKNNLLSKSDFKFDIEEKFKDEEPSIIMPNDDHENSGFEVLFDETDLETFSDFIEDERSNKIVFSEIEPLEVLMGKSGIDSANEENDYNFIPQHVLASFDKGTESDSILNSSDDLFDEIQETLRNITEGTLDETKDMYLLDENLLKSQNSQENSSYHSEELISQIDNLTNKHLNENEPNSYVMVKQDQLQSFNDNTENCQNDGIILELENDEKCVNKYTDVFNNDILKINQTDQVSEITQELDSTEDIVDSDKTVSNNTIITNNEISDSLEIKTVKINNVSNMKTTADDAFTSSTINNKENTSKIENFSDQVQDEIIKTNNDQLEIMNAIKNIETTNKNLDFNNEISEGLLKSLDTIEFIEIKDDFSETINSQDIQLSEQQNNEISDFSEKNEVHENIFNHSNENIVDISLEVKDCNSSIKVVTEKVASPELHVDKTSVKNFKELLVLENSQQKLDNIVKEEITTIINSETENEIITEKRKLASDNDDNNIECKNDTTINNCLMIKDVDTTIIEENPNEIKQCISNLNDNDTNDVQNKNADTFKETFDQVKEFMPPLNPDSITVSKNITISNDCNNSKENVILRGNKFDIPFDKVELVEEADLDRISKGDFQECINLCFTTGEKINVSESSLIIYSNKENLNAEKDINSNEDHIPCNSNKIESVSIIKEHLENVEQILSFEGKSSVNNLNGINENKIKESNKKCKILSNVSETHENDVISEKLVLPTDSELLIDSNCDIKEGTSITDISNKIEDDSTLEQNIENNVDLKISNIEEAVQLVNLEVPKEEFNENNELFKNIPNILGIDKLINTENNETETHKIPNESYKLNMDSGIKEIISLESKYDTLKKLEFSSDFSMNQEEIFSNEINIENSIQISTAENKNSGMFINTSDNSFKGLEQTLVSENNNATDRVNEFQNNSNELIKEPLTVDNTSLTNSKIVISDSIQPINQQKFDGNEIEVKYGENRKNFVREKEIILESNENNKSNSEHLETKDGNEEKLLISKINNLKEESIEFNTNSSNIPITQNAVLVCDEVNSTEFVQPIREVIDNNFKIIDKKSEQVIENLIHNGKNNEQEEKIEPYNESSIENNSGELDRNDNNKGANKNVIDEQIEIQTLKSNDEKANLTTNIKDKNVTGTENVEKILTTKPELYYESGIETCMAENKLVNSLINLVPTNTNSEKDKCVDIIHSYDLNNLPFEENKIKNVENIEYNSMKQRGSVSNQNNIHFNNTESTTVNFSQATKEPNICYSYLDENNVNQYRQVTESQIVDILENENNLKTNLKDKSTQIKTTNETESMVIEILNENILANDETESLSSCDITTENVSEIFMENLVRVEEITKMNLLESSIDNDKNVEKIKQKELNIENIKTELTELKNLENIDMNLKPMINDTSLDVTKSQEETNVKNLISTGTNVFESTKIEYLLDNTDTSINYPLNQNLRKEFCISNKNNDTAEQNIQNQSPNEINELEYTSNLIKLKSDDEGSLTLVNDQEKQENGVIVINNDGEQSIKEKFEETTFNKNEIKTLYDMTMNKRVNVSDLKKKADLLCETVAEDEIIDLIVDRDLNDLAIKLKLDYIEQNAANQTECVALENVNVLKQNERSSMENITEHAQVEHELNIAAIGDIVMNYDSVKENSSKSSFDLYSLLETAIIATNDEHSNEVVMKNNDFCILHNDDLIIKHTDFVTEKPSSEFIDKSIVIKEDNSCNIITSSCVQNLNEKGNESNKENRQIKKEVIQKCPVKLESDEDIFKEPRNNDVMVYDTQESLNIDDKNVDNLRVPTDVISPLNDNNAQVKKNEPSSNVANNTQGIKVTNSETIKDTDDRENIKQRLSLYSNTSSPDIFENLEEKNKFICEVEEGTKELSNDKKPEFEMKPQNNKGSNKNISLENENEVKILGDIEKVDSNENQIENQKSNQVDANQIKPMKDKMDIDKKKEGSKKKTCPQPQNKKLPTSDKSLENSENKNKIDEKMKIIDSNTEESNIYFLKNQEKVIELESNLKLNSLEECNKIISMVSGNGDNINVAEETGKIIENDERTENQKNNKLDANQIQTMKYEVDTDKNKANQQLHDNKLVSLNTSLENNESEIKIDENTKEKSKMFYENDDNTQKLEYNSELETTVEVKTNDLKILQNENNKNLFKENNKIISNDDTTENNNPDTNQIQSMIDQLGNDNKKQRSKKKKTNINIQEKHILIPDQSLENNKIDGKTKITDLTNETSKVLLKDQKKNIKLESKLELDSSEERSTIISKISNNENDKNMVKETDKMYVNDDQTKNHNDHVFDTDKILLIKNEEDIDNAIHISKNMNTNLQLLQDKKVSSLNTFLENNEEEKEKLKIIESTTEENGKQLIKDKEKIIKMESNLEEVLVLENNKNTSKALQNNNDIVKNTTNYEQNENNKLEMNKNKFVKKESDTDNDTCKEKREIKKNKKSLLPQTENLTSSDELMGITDTNYEIKQVIEVKPNMDFDETKNEKVSSDKLSGMTEKEIKETDKNKLNTVQNEIIIDNLKQIIQIRKDEIPENNKIDILEANDKIKNELKTLEVDKNVINNSSMNQNNIEEKMNYELLSEESTSLENLVKTTNIETDKKWKSIDVKENDWGGDERKREIEYAKKEDSCLEVTKLENSNSDKNKKAKSSKREQVKCIEENRRKLENKDVVQSIRVSPEKSSMKETTIEIRVTEKEPNESYDNDMANQIGETKSSNVTEKLTVQYDGKSDSGKYFTKNRWTTTKDKDVTSGEWTNHINTVTKIGFFDAPIAQRRNFETRSPTPFHGYEEHGVPNHMKTSALARSEERQPRGKDTSPSRRYLAVTDAYRSRLMPSTYRSLTPEPSRFSELTRTYTRSASIGVNMERYHSARSFSSYVEQARPMDNSFYERNLSPANAVYRSPSETTLKTYRRLDDDDLSWYSRLRRRGSDSFLLGLHSWNNYSKNKLSITKDDLNRTKETFKRLYFCVRLIDQTISSGTRVKFWCSIIGYPEPRVQWYRDGQKLNSFTYNSSTRYQTKFTNGLAQLIIDDAQSGDSGEYTCVAVNSEDRITTTGFLTVYTSSTMFGITPKKPLQSASLSMDRFKSTNLDRLYQWSGHDLQQNFRISSDWQSSNDVLRYPKYPKFVTSIIADDITTYGGTIALQVRVQGSPLPNVSWIRQSKPLPRLSIKYVYLNEGELHTLLVKDSTAKDGGTYVCQACNLYGTANVEKTVKVVSSQDYSEHRGVKPAIIVSRPNDRLSVAVGEDITVTLRVAGEPKPKVVWMRGSRDVTFLDRSLKETVNDYVKLSIKKAQLSDAGTYFIIAKNVYGSDRAFVTVGVRKRARSLTPPQIRNTIGRWNSIGGGGCSAKNDVPGPVLSEPVVFDRANNRISLRWDKPNKAETILVYKVDKQSADKECWRQVGLTPTNSIDVYNLKSGNRYKFRVTARNRFGWGQPVVTSDYVDVWELKNLPEFFQPLPGETKTLLGHNAKLQCHVRGVPSPQVTWFKDGEPLVTKKYVSECTERGRCTLTIIDVMDEDAGRYACEAVNVCGRVSTLTIVEVMANRRIVEAEQKLQGCLMKNNEFKESAPVFTKRLNNRRVEINSTVRLSCQVHGLPVPSVLWYKDNCPVDITGDKKSYRDSDNFSTLELIEVKYDDSGAYTAVATNSIGTASTDCMLEVINKKCMDPAVPEFIFGLPPTLETADSIILKAQIDAYRPVKVEWFRDGIQLRNGRRVDIITNHDGNLELRIACVTKRDSGTYMLKVSNNTGTIESRCDVDVVEYKDFNTGLEQISLANNLYSKKPKFVVKPKFQEVEEGQEVIIDSEIVGDPLPKITWLRDGLKPEYYRDNSEFTCISNGYRHQLKIPHAKITHTGTYTLLATNPHGQIKTLISLQVYSTGHCKKKMENGTNRTTVERLPRISRGLSDIDCSENDCVTFECKLNITQETNVRWQKDGKLVRLGKDIKSELVGGDTARLEISAVGPLHEGLYTCTAFNELGQDSTSARLILLDSARDITSKSATLSNGQRKTIPGSPKLAGESNDRSSKRLKRSSAPKFYAVLHDKIADVGETVRFQCSVSGHPPPWSSWEKDGRPIGINSRMKIREDDDRRSLEICDITADDAGLYRITVENKFGKILATARLEVMTHHQATDVQITSSTNGRRQSGSTACAGENFTLSCDIRGNSMSDVTWYKNDEEVKPDDRVTLNRDDLASRLSISNLELADTGVYTCIARCESGVTRCSTELCVFDTKLAKDSYLQPPIFAEGLVPMCTGREGERVELTVKLQGAVPMSATWFKDNVPIPDCEDFAYMVGDNGKFSLSIVDPFSADSGNYSCKVVNTFGEAVSHGQLVIKEIENDHLVQSVAQQNSDMVLTELNNNLKIGGKDTRDINPRHKEPTTEAITALLPATVLWGPCDTTVLRGAKVVLETSYAGKPEPRVQWFRAGKVLAETDERLRITNADGISSLTIDSITADDCGKYIVRVENGLGNDYHFASVAVEGPPEPPAGRPEVSVSETSADVTWSSPAYDGGCMVTGYSVEVRPFNQSDWKLVADKCHSLSHIVRGLAPGESYVFRVRAENMHGSSEASLESIPVYILQTDYGNTLVPKKVNIENGELFTKQYEVLDELGKGRYGVVRKVKEYETGKYYAAKFVRCIKSKDKEKAQEEVDIMNCLRHPKLLQLDAAYENPREVVMVTEYISGGELFERVVADDFTLTEKDCILFTRQICEGVDYMHKQNVVHLDLKPENIMCQSRTSHQIKLIDFGLAQKIIPGKPIRVLFGTPEFIPPEIISYEPIGVESDMWSVGVICYVLLSGLSPFMGDNDPETFNNITKAEFDFDDESFDAISQDSKDFISALLIKKKEKRLTARECLKHKWLAQQDMDMSCVILSTDKLKKFIIRRKWQKTGNAIRALGRMATLSAASRRCGGSGGGTTGGGGGGAGSQQLKMASLSEEESAGDSSSSSSPLSSSPSPPHHDDESRTSAAAADVQRPKTTVAAADESAAITVAMSRGGRRSCDVRSDSGFSECSSLASSSSSSSSSSAAMATGHHHVRLSTEKPSAIAEETCHQPLQPPVTSRPTTAGATATHPTKRSPAHVLPSLGVGGIGGVCQKNRLIFEDTTRKGGAISGAAGRSVVGSVGRVAAGSTTVDAVATSAVTGPGVHRKEPIRIQTGDNFKKAVAFWKQ